MSGPSLVPTSTGQASGFHRVKLGLKGNGLGWSFKPKKAAVSGPTKLASKVCLPSSSQRPYAEELKLAFEVRLAVSGAKISMLEQEVGESPPRRLGESPPLSTLPACKDCVGALDGNGPSLGDMPIPLVSSLEVPVVDFPLGMDRDESVFGCPAEDGSLLGVALLKDSEQTLVSS